jgi:hypothetical protein
MKTDDLITMLSANVEAVDPRHFRRVFVLAVTAGAIIAIGVTLLTLGSRADFRSPAALGFVCTKLLFAVAVSTLALICLARLARPGGALPMPITLIALPFAGIAGLAAISLSVAPAAHRHTMLLDGEWLECLLSIPILAIVPFVLVVWALRQAAPTHLRSTGAFAGLVAGGLSATGYALHCVGDSLPFVALWYSGTIVLCTLLGAALGPRLLRW